MLVSSCCQLVTALTSRLLPSNACFSNACSFAVYMDNHATTRVDPRVVEAMLPYFTEQYGNPGSVSHSFGGRPRRRSMRPRAEIAAAIGASDREIVFTSGATESNNLALRGIADRPRRKGNHFVSVATEHKAVLDPLARLARRGFEVTLLPVEQAGSERAGLLDLQRLADAIRADTILVSVMLANNEIGVIQPLAEICRHLPRARRSVALRRDAGRRQDARRRRCAGRRPDELYRPQNLRTQGCRRASMCGGAIPRCGLQPQIDGGGQEGGVRSGTLNVPGIVGFARALSLVPGGNA